MATLTRESSHLHSQLAASNILSLNRGNTNSKILLNFHSKRYSSAEIPERKFSIDTPILNKLHRWFDVSG